MNFFQDQTKRRFNDLTKERKLQLLGKIYDALNAIPAHQVYLDEVMTETAGCGSVGCVAGWMVADESAAEAMGLVHSSQGQFRTLGTLRELFLDSLFHEQALSRFLFGTLWSSERKAHYTNNLEPGFYSPKRIALARLLYIGRLVDQDEYDILFECRGSALYSKVCYPRNEHMNWVMEFLDKHPDANLGVDYDAQGDSFV